MLLETAKRRRAKIRMSLQGPSGSGKTHSSLLLAFGLCGDWNKIAVVDTEHHSAELYSDLGPYKVLNLAAPFTPERYMDAITICEQGGMEVVILDSITHEWEYLLDYHSSLPGNSFTNWNKITPRHNALVQRILHSSSHVIATVRTKQDYVLTEKNGKQVPEKVGLKSVQRDGLEYEFTLVFDLDIKNNATASKDRTGLFHGKPEQKITIDTGREILNWCKSGDPITADDITRRIGDTKSIEELLTIFYQYPDFQASLKPEFEQQKRRLIINDEAHRELGTGNIPMNGTGH
ncbi:AAA family ATPase [Polluticoccus soli]|uniref:AAA family ATPase n=1 Tax=Polluticoccus soli TaxID=3034150 RepID=UPI0023E17634|nr:AAA family ATPase [Flavipsychrobacter sp. JY13-12]